MRYPLLAARVYNCPLMVAPGKAEIIERAFRAAEEGQSALLSPHIDAPKLRAALDGSTIVESGYERTSDGIALIRMLGPLVQRGGMNFPSGGPTGYNEIAGQLNSAIADPRVHAILLEIDSPGGEANGAFDLHAKIRSAGTKKPVWAIAVEQAFSAAYLQAAGASRLLVPEPGMVGSIGVVMLHVDQSQRDARMGMVYTPIFAGDRKVDFSSHAPLSEDALAMAQAEVRRVYELFVSAVADGRNIDAQIVRDTQAALMEPRAALAIGLIDGIQSLDETLAELAAEAQHVRFHGMRSGSARAQQGSNWREILAQREQEAATAASIQNAMNIGAIDMANENMFTAAQVAAAKAEGVTEGKTSAESDAAKKLAEAQSMAATAAQARISAILTHAEAEGRSKLAQHLAFKTNTSVEDAIAMLAASDKATGKAGNPLAEAMGKIPNPKVGADSGVDDEPKKATVIGANDLFAKRRAQAGHGGKAA